MKTNEILIIPKMTKIECDMKRLRLSFNEILDFYKKEGLNLDKILCSHNLQKENLNKALSLVRESRMITRDELNKEIVKKYSLIISFGGDNHFQYVSHFLENVPILGINSDPVRSLGALTSMNTNEFETFLPEILNDKFRTEDWTRLKVTVDGKAGEYLAISEIFIGEERRISMSRHILNFKGKSEEQKGSGIIVSTGAGSSGWYDSAARFLFEGGNRFSKTENGARFILTEPFNGRLSNLRILHGNIGSGEKIEITSLSDSQAILSIDCLEFIKIREGAKIEIEIDRPLKVVRYS